MLRWRNTAMVLIHLALRRPDSQVQARSAHKS